MWYISLALRLMCSVESYVIFYIPWINFSDRTNDSAISCRKQPSICRQQALELWRVLTLYVSRSARNWRSNPFVAKIQTKFDFFLFLKKQNLTLIYVSSRKIQSKQSYWRVLFSWTLYLLRTVKESITVYILYDWLDPRNLY